MEKCGVCILGSTGSIGQNTLDIIKQHPDVFKVVALSANHSVETMFEQCCQFQPQFAVMVQEDAAHALKQRLSGLYPQIQILSGSAGLEFIAQLPEVQKVVAAIVGAAGLLSTMCAVNAGKQVLIANKEPLVMAGDLLVNAAKQSGAILLPLDSEHNALFQCMPAGYKVGTRPEGVQKIILTASGGPFLNSCSTYFPSVTPEMACQHPNWKMGKKITVDCATLMNKGLEVIEACRLFQFAPEEVEVVVHPQSVIHSLVEYVDGSILAQLGSPDMRIPIAYSLFWPIRKSVMTKRLSLTEIGQLTFLPPNHQKFRCLPLAYEAVRLGGAAPTVLNASNEIAVQAFLQKRIAFSAIPALVENVLQKLYDLSASTLKEILWADQLAREQAIAFIKTNPL